MTTCIVCTRPKSETDFHPEHVFPSAIGGRFVVYNVCDNCNHSLGSTVDGALTDHWYIQARRMQLGLSGNSSKVPNPLARGHVASDPTIRIRDLVAGDGGPGKPIVENSVRRTEQPDGSERVSIVVDKSDAAKLPDIVNKILIRAGHDPLPVAEIEKHAIDHSIEEPIKVTGVTIDDVEYKRGILKIAYELACRWLGDTFLADPVAVDIRKCLLAPKSTSSANSLCGRIDLTSSPPIIPAFWGPNVHASFMHTTSEHIVVAVRIFDIFEALVIVSNEPHRYAGVASLCVTNDSVTGEVHEGPFEDELIRAAG